MNKWIVKAIVQKVISYLPFCRDINYFFQKYITKGVYLKDDYFCGRLEHAREHLKYFQKFSKKKVPLNSLEIGTGWYPVVPVAFFLSGVNEIYSVDISFLTSKERIKITLHKFIESYKNGELLKYIPIVPNRMVVLEDTYKKIETLSLAELLKKMRIIYLIEDARKLSLPDNSIDLINSNNTFEHIYPDILLPILAELKRIVKKKMV